MHHKVRVFIEEEAAEELVGRQRLQLQPIGAAATIVLVAERNPALVEADRHAGRLLGFRYVERCRRVIWSARLSL